MSTSRIAPSGSRLAGCGRPITAARGDCSSVAPQQHRADSDHHVTSIDWASDPILRFPDVPAIDVVLISRPDQPAWGVGEPTCSVVACAVSNAVFDAIGVRLRTVPFTPERVRRALAV